MTRIALVATGDPLHPATWSGSGAGLAGGLRARGIDVEGVDVAPPRGLREAGLAAGLAATRSRLDAGYSEVALGLADRVGARRLRRLGSVDGIVLFGAQTRLPKGSRYVVWSDMTLAQARRVHPVFAGLAEPVYRRWHRRQSEILAAATALAAGSDWTAASLVDDFGADPAKVHVVGFGRNHDPAQHTGDWSPPRFLFVGREWERKGGSVLLEAFGRVVAEAPDATLDVVGEHPALDAAGVTGHGPLRLDEPEEAARVERLFAQATCLVVPSEVEPFGIVHCEALAAGIPSIGTTVGGPATILGDGGVLVEPGDPDALADAMLRLCDPAVAQRMGAVAAERAPLYTWDAVAGRMLVALGL